MQFVQKQCDSECITAVVSSPFVIEHKVAIQLISQGYDIWEDAAPTPLVAFRNLYQARYAALPTNSQFTERGVKESSYITLGRCSKKHQSILSTARAKLIPDAMVKGRRKTETEDGEKKTCRVKYEIMFLWTRWLNNSVKLTICNREIRTVSRKLIFLSMKR